MHITTTYVPSTQVVSQHSLKVKNFCNTRGTSSTLAPVPHVTVHWSPWWQMVAIWAATHCTSIPFPYHSLVLPVHHPVVHTMKLPVHHPVSKPENTEHQQMAFGETDERSLTWTFSTSRQFGSIWLMAKTDIFKCSADDDFGAYSSCDSLDCLSWCIGDDTGGITIELISKSKDYHWKRKPTFTKMHFICNPFSVIPGRKLTRKGQN